MRLEPDQAFALALVREAEASALIGEVRPRGLSAGGGAPGIDALLADARERIAARPELARLWRARDWLSGRAPGLWLALPALALGFAFTSLTSDGRLNILTPPLLGLLLWQLLVYALLAGRRLLRAPVAAGVSGPLRSAVLAVARRLPVAGGGPSAAFAARLVQGWSRLAAAQLGAGIAVALHAGAAAFALGALLGLYVAGLGVAYHAYWESTFLGTGAVQALVDALLGPAALVTGLPLPDADGLHAMQTTPVPAAPWIHLWAATIALWAILPRLLLAGFARAARRRPVDWPDADPWLQGSLATLAGTPLALRAQALGYRPEPATLERLQTRIRDRFGSRAQLTANAPLPWDADAGAVETGAARRLLLLVNPAQTPEEDVHGPLLDELAARLDLTVVIDAGAYVTSADRRSSRVDGWTRALDARGIDHMLLEAP